MKAATGIFAAVQRKAGKRQKERKKKHDLTYDIATNTTAKQIH